MLTGYAIINQYGKTNDLNDLNGDWKCCALYCWRDNFSNKPSFFALLKKDDGIIAKTEKSSLVTGNL